MSEARVCRDQLCNDPISVGRVISDFVGTSGKNHLDLKQGENVYIYAKNPDETPELWFGQAGGKDGYFPKEHVEEYIVYEPNPSFVVSKDILEDADDSDATDSTSNQNEGKNADNTSKEGQPKQSDSTSDHDNSDGDESIEDALKSEESSTADSKPTTGSAELNKQTEHQKLTKDQDKTIPKGGNDKKLPQFIPGEYMSLPREELMKILDERNKILNSPENVKDEPQKVFEPAVNNPVNDPANNQESLSNDNNKTLDEVVQNVQESLKAVVEEDLKNHFGKKQTEDNVENMGNSIKNNDENTQQGDNSQDAGRQKRQAEDKDVDPNVSVNDKDSLSKREHADNPTDKSASAPAQKEEIAEEEGDEEDYEDEEVEPIKRVAHPSKDTNTSSDEAKDKKQNAYEMDQIVAKEKALNIEGDDKNLQKEDKASKNQPEENINNNFQTDEASKNLPEENMDKNLQKEEKASKNQPEENRNKNLLKDEASKNQSEENMDEKEGISQKEIEKDNKKDKLLEEKEREMRLKLLLEERKRIEALDEQANLLLQKRKELEKKMEQEKLIKKEQIKKEEEKHKQEEKEKEAEQQKMMEREAVKRKEEEERKERVKLEVEKRLKAIEEQAKKKAEEEAKREEQRKEQERILKEREKELELKKIEEDVKKRMQAEREAQREELRKEQEKVINMENERKQIEEKQRKEEQMKMEEEKKRNDRLKEELEIEASLKERLAAMSSITKPTKLEQDDVPDNTIEVKKSQEETSKVSKGSEKEQSHVVEKARKVLSSKQNLIQNRFNKMKQKTDRNGKKINKKSKKGKKKKKRFYDLSVSKDDDSDEDEDEEEKVPPKKRLPPKKELAVELKTDNTITSTISVMTGKPTILATPSSLYTSDSNNIKTTEQISTTSIDTQGVNDEYNKQESTDKIPPSNIESSPASTENAPGSSTDNSIDSLVSDKGQQADAGVVAGNESAHPTQQAHHEQTQTIDDGKIIQQTSTEPTPLPTSDTHTVHPSFSENATEPPRPKTFGILRGFWRCHEVFAESVMLYGQPVKGALSGLLGIIGLGQIFDDICQDLVNAPPMVLICTILVGTLGAAFLLCTCIGSLNSRREASGPRLRDILKTYEARIQILEEERDGLERSNKEMELKFRHALEEKHRADDGASTARKNLENVMLKIKQYEEEYKNLEMINNSNREEMKASIEELERKDEDFEKLQKKLDEYKEQFSSQENTIGQLKEELIKLEGRNDSLEHQINALNDKVDNQEKGKDKLNEQLKEWCDKYDNLQQSLDDQHLRNSQIQEQYEFKCNEVEVLQDCLLQIKGQELSEEDEDAESMTEEEKDKERSNRLKAMLDASKAKTEAKITSEENIKLNSELEVARTTKEALEEQVQNIQKELSQAKLNEEKAYLDFREKEIELTALRKYFKDTESDLHRKLTAEESAREATENKLKTELSKASADSQDLDTYKKLYAEINEEIKRVKGNVNHQVAQVEERAHNNWIKYRTVERELEEVKRERDALRRRIYAVEKDKNRPGSSQSAKSSDSNDGGRSESPLRGPPPPGHAVEHHSPVPMSVPPPIHPLYGPPRMPMGYGPPPPPTGRYGPPPPPPGHIPTPPPHRNGQGLERDLRKDYGYDPNGPRQPSPSRAIGNPPDKPPVSTDRRPKPSSTKHHSVENNQADDSPPLYAPHPSVGSPLMRHPSPVRPHYGPMGPRVLRPPYGSPIPPPVGQQQVRPTRLPPPGQSPGTPPTGTNIYRKASGRQPTGSSLS